MYKVVVYMTIIKTQFMRCAALWCHMYWLSEKGQSISMHTHMCQESLASLVFFSCLKIRSHFIQPVAWSLKKKKRTAKIFHTVKWFMVWENMAAQKLWIPSERIMILIGFLIFCWQLVIFFSFCWNALKTNVHKIK